MAGPQCCANPPNLSFSCGSGAGHVEEIGGLKSYITGSPDSKIAVLLVSDVFGYEAPKLRYEIAEPCPSGRGETGTLFSVFKRGEIASEFHA